MMIQPTPREVELHRLIREAKDSKKIAEYRAELKKIWAEQEKDPVMIQLHKVFG